jgi:hypothetical protein
MALRSRLPTRFPVGTRYIVEGEPGTGGELRIVSRYMVMPSGVRYDLMKPADRMRNKATSPRTGRARVARRAV